MTLRPFLLALGVLLIAILLDFGLFLDQITRPASDTTRIADGIAVLTGARERINAAARLLAEGKGGRLLISGVNERTNLADLLRIEPALEPLMDCCVDLGRKATNTIGNAQEITGWARTKNYHTLWLVTSDYHMPRALLELHHAYPELILFAWPVTGARKDRLPAPGDANSWRLIASEWIKVHAVYLRIALGLPIADNE